MPLLDVIMCRAISSFAKLLWLKHLILITMFNDLLGLFFIHWLGVDTQNHLCTKSEVLSFCYS